MKINVLSIVGSEDAITFDDGEAVYNRIHPELAAGRPVELDFDRVTVFASPFFNAAIGQLLRDLKPDALNQLLKVENLGPVGADVMRQVIANSKKYYADPEYRKAVDQVVEAMSQEA